MNSNSIKKTDIPYMTEKHGLITNVSNSFCQITDYHSEELLGKNLGELWNKLLRIDVALKSFDIRTTGFMFTRSLEARHVEIQRLKKSKSDETVYYVSELQNSRFEDKNQFIEKVISDNKIGVAVFSAPDFLLIKANQVYLDYLPKPDNTKEHLYGKCLKDFVPNFESSRIGQALKDSADNNRSIYIKEFNGFITISRNRYLDVTLVPVTENGKVNYLVLMLDEVTKYVRRRKYSRKQARFIKQQKQELETKSMQLLTILDNLDDSILLYNIKGEVVFANKVTRMAFKMQQISDLNAAVNSYKNYDENGNELSFEDTPLAKSLKGEHVSSVIIRAVKCKEVSYLNISTIPIFNCKRELEFVIAISRDVTKAHLSQTRMFSENKKLEAVIGNICDALAVVDRDGKLMIANDAAKKIISDRAWLEYYDEDNDQLHFQNLLSTRVLGGEKITKMRYIDKSNNCEKYAELSATPVFDETGELYFCILASHDITELIQKDNAIRKQNELLIKAETEKREALENAMKLKDEFVYLITHEFKTPIAVISSALQTIDLLYGHQIPEKVNKFLNSIRQNTNRELRLVNNLLDITRICAGHHKVDKINMDIVLLTRLITESIRVFAEQKGITLSFSSTITNKIIGIDEEKYERILLNLLSNAVKYTPKGKAIAVRVSQKAAVGSSKVCIQVIDKGIGIPKDKMDYIFERFGQVDSSLARQAEGSGIGLYLVRMLVELLGGEITLKSKEAEGSIFTVTLPTAKVKNLPREKVITENSGNRLIQATAIEFSDIYM